MHEDERDLRQTLQRAVTLAENALMQAKLALAMGDVDAANAALADAGEAHALAQRLRAEATKRSAA
jgi:hypothetical protein